MACKKQRYITRALAKKELKRINATHQLVQKLTNVYYHAECGYWHTTSMHAPLSRAMTRKQKPKI